MPLLAAPLLRAQPAYTLTLADALQLSQNQSESVDIARAGLRSAGAERIRARAQKLPQLFGNAGYTRTLASQYSALYNSGNNQGSGNLSALPFGRTNIYTFGLSASQAVFAGGRLGAQSRLADALYQAAELQIDTTNAQFVLDVSTAFYDAALADRLLAIAQATLADAEETLRFVQLGFDEGRLPQFDVLRASVSRRNQVPAVAQRQAQRDQAYLRLKQLLNLPPATTLSLQSDLNSSELPVPASFEERFRNSEPQVQVDQRVPVRQAAATVTQRAANVDIAKSQRWPSINLSSDFGLFAYPQNPIPTALNQFRKNWTVGVTLNLPILTFGRIKADVESAEANLDQANAQRSLTRELAELDSSVVASQLATALEQWQAVSGGFTEAQQAYDIASLRYRQGISSQLEVNDARLSMQQAQVNVAQAARDLQVARITVALLPLLPINSGPQAPSQTRPLVQQQSQQQFAGQGTNPFTNTTRATSQAPNAAPASSGIPGVPATQMGIPGASRIAQ